MAEQAAGKMTRWGIGPRFAVISLIYGAAALALQYTAFPEFLFVLFDKTVNLILGLSLIVIGLVIFLVPAFTIDRYFTQGRLYTQGIYAYMRHPIYGAWISFIVPGMIIMVGSVVGLTIPGFMYLVFKTLIPNEEKYLSRRFGREYEDYHRKVWSVFPKLF